MTPVKPSPPPPGPPEPRASGREAGELAPEHGARFVLTLLAVTERGARYEVRVEPAAPGAPARATAALDAHGATLDAWDGAVETWAHESALGFLRTLAKNHAADGDWPAVLRRWRSPR